eukprot:TRINITY_DN17321_c0_g1_i2.p2 TRINITY_DN17321_c0_g1~~TRINITY_DN17321_c0_g1_i2.p2  ORF type:complete len:130 (+),score=18.99 TRINITY_DN17321_c0_g1_i2:129-518(+)
MRDIDANAYRMYMYSDKGSRGLQDIRDGDSNAPTEDGTGLKIILGQEIDEETEGMCFDLQRNLTDHPDPNDFHEIKSEMKRNPKEFFNFGFNYDDYRAFMAKHILMRIERLIILKARDEAKLGSKPVGQ